jgi:hypothetical protein
MSDHHDDPSGDVEQRWHDRLTAYLDGQGELVEELRRRVHPHPPWPEADNPMIGYLSERALEIAADDGIETAMVWLAVHAWFESAVDERARILRSITS